jgi:hypothetical protein
VPDLGDRDVYYVGYDTAVRHGYVIAKYLTFAGLNVLDFLLLMPGEFMIVSIALL